MAGEERISDIIDLPKSKEQVNRLIELLDTVDAKIKGMGQITLEYKNSNASGQGAATTQLTAAQKELLALQEKLNAETAKSTLINSDLSKQLAVQREMNAQKARDLKAEAQQLAGMNDAYKTLVLQYNAAQKAAKNLSVEYGENSKQAIQASKAALELSERLKGIDKSVGQSFRNVGNYPEAMKGFQTLGDKGAEAAHRIGDKFKETFADIARVAVGFFGIQAGFQFLEKSIETFEKSEMSIKREENALRNLGATAKDVKVLQDSITDLTKQYTYLSKVDLRDAQQKLITYGKLTGEQMKEILPTIVNFAANARIDVPEATSLMIKALEGNAKALKVYGINIKDAKDESARFALIQTELADKVAGSAQVFAESGAGKIETYKRQIGALQRQIGEQLMPIYESFLDGSIGIGKALKAIDFGNIVKGILALAGGYLIYRGAVIAANIAAAINGSIQVANTAITMELSAAKAFETLAEESNGKAVAANTVVTYLIISAKKLYATVTRLATLEVTLFNTAIKISPLGVFLSILGIGVTLFTAFAASAQSSSSALANQARNQQLVNDTASEALKNTAEQRKTIDELTDKVKNHNISLGDRKKALEELVALDPKYLEGLTLENIETDKGRALIDNYVLALNRKAQAEALNQRLVENYKKESDVKGQGPSQDDMRGNMLENAKDALTGGNLSGYLANKAIRGAEAQNDKLKEITSERKAINDELTKLGSNPVEFNQTSGLGKYNESGKEKKTGGDDTNARLKARQDENKAIMELQKMDLEHQNKYLQAIETDEKNSMFARIAAIGNFAKNRIKINEMDRALELEGINAKLDEIDKIESISVKKRTGAQKSLLIEKDALMAQAAVIEKKRFIENENIELDSMKRILEMQKKYAAEQLKIADEAQKKKDEQEKKDFNNQIAHIKRMGEDGKLTDVKDELAQHIALNQALNDGTISLEKYNEEKAKIVEDGTQKQIDNLKLVAKAYRDTGLANLSIETQIAELEIKLSDNVAKKKLENNKKEVDNKKKIADALKQLAKEVYNLAVTVISAQFDKEKNIIQEKIDLISANKSADIDRINSSTLSEQDKANKIAIINAKAQADTEQLQKRQKEVDLQKAKFDREKAIFEIVINTAVAIGKAVEAFPLTGGMPLSAIDAAIGAAQIATILAKPLPKFAVGTDHAPGGPAWVGERGAELVINPSGKAFMTPDSATVMNLEKGSKVITHDEVNKMMLNQMMVNTAGQTSINHDITAQKLEEVKDAINLSSYLQTKELAKAINKGKTPVINKISINTRLTEHIHNQVFK